MRIVACTDVVGVLVLGCPDDELSTANVTATLTRSDAPAIAVQLVAATPTDDSFDEFVVSFVVPAGLRRGRWTLTVKTPCGCYTLPLYSNNCPPPRALSSHEPTTPVAPTETCPPPLQPDFSLPNPTLGFLFARAPLPSDLLGIDLGVYGSLVAPHPSYTDVLITAADGTLPIAGAFVLPSDVSHLHGAPWTLYDPIRSIVAEGVLSVIGGSITFSASLTDPLTCGRYTLAIEYAP